MGNNESIGSTSSWDSTILKNYFLEEKLKRKADELGQKAAEAQNIGKTSEAVELYTAAADYYSLALKYEIQGERDKDAIKKRHRDCLNAVEQMKKNFLKKIDVAVRAISTSSKQEECADKTTAEVARIEAADDPNVHWSDIAGLATAKESLKEAVVLPAKFPHLFMGCRELCRGVLLYGPPGSGKSQLCKAAATESGSALFSISSSHVFNGYQGHSERLIKALFENARAKKPAVIFITKLESLFVKMESLPVAHSGSLFEQLTSIKKEFLSQMREDNEGVVVLATTNKPWDLDEDIVRCFKKQLFVDLPDWETRTELFKLNLRYIKNSVNQLDYLTLGQVTEGYSGADIEVIVREALMLSVHKVQTSTHFKKVTEPDPIDPATLVSDLYTPCTPSAPDAFEMEWVDVPSNKLLEPQVTYKDCMCSVQKTRPTITPAELEEFMKFSIN